LNVASVEENHRAYNLLLNTIAGNKQISSDNCFFVKNPNNKKAATVKPSRHKNYPSPHDIASPPIHRSS
jgi:hypothetical protein